jgi:tryptophan synthase alpha chain
VKKLVVYLMAGPETPELAEAAAAAGADVVEIGFPFSDPLADGPVIRRAGERALAQGMRTGRCLEAYGWERFDTDARAAGATSLIVADLPSDEQPELRRIQLVAPTSTDERIRGAAQTTDGWLYLVTVAGITGERHELSPALAPLVERARRLTDMPLYAGFGISTPEHARAAAELCDGIVVGTRAVEKAEEGPLALSEWVTSLRDALDSVASPV